MLTNTALKILRRLLGPNTIEKRPYADGNTTILDGATAVAVTESMVSESAALGAESPLHAAALAWRNTQQRQASQLASGDKLGSITAESARGALAAAIGQAMTGMRTTAFISGNDLSYIQDLLQTAVNQRVALVLHIGLRGHEALHVVADSGAIVLFAANVQEAVDFTLIAHKLSEQLLLPVLVAQDGEQTALALQNVVLPTAALIEKFLSRPGSSIATPDTEQQFLFGDIRRCVPRWHDPDRPILLGAHLPPAVAALSQAGASVYLNATAASVVHTVLQEFSSLCGRNYQPCSRYRLEDADIVLVAQGATIETAESVCDYVRSAQLRLKVGVLGVRCVRPFISTDLSRWLHSKLKVCVLERVTTPMATDSPLLRELHVALRPQLALLSVSYGLNGAAASASDLVALCREAATITQPQIFLGLKFMLTESPYPKRQVVLDKLRSRYPTLATQSLQATTVADVRIPGCVTVSLHYLAGGAGDGVLPELALLLQRLLKGGLRCQPGVSKNLGHVCVERLSVAANSVKDLGADSPADVAVVMADINLPELWPLSIAKGGSLIMVSKWSEEVLLARLPAARYSELKQANIVLYRLPAHVGVIEREEFLGAVCAVLIEREKLDTSKWRLLAVRDELLGTAVTGRMNYFSAGLDAVRRIDWPSSAIRHESSTAAADTAPIALRRLGSVDSAYDSLSHFWDQVGVLYARGDTAELIPDPYLAIGTVPTHSAALRDLSYTRINLPALDPTQCTACGACWSVCPDGAWNAAVLGLTAILDAGMKAAEATTMRPLLGKLTIAVTQLLQADQPNGNLNTLLETAFTKLYAQLPFPDDRKAAIAKDMEKLIAVIGTLPVIATDTMFKEPEAQTSGSGALLALALNTDACKGCAMCVTSCEAGALSLQPQDAFILEQLRRTSTTWELLPPSNPDSLTRLTHHSDFAPLASKLLAPGARKILTGGDSMEAGSGAKLAMRLALNLSEAQQTPIQKAWKTEVQDAHSQIMVQIRNLLADTLPTADLETLSQRLTAIGSAPADLTTLLGSTQADAVTSFDSARLQRLVNIAKDLADLDWRLTVGRSGQGRANTAVVLSLRDSATFGIEYPYNPFGCPVTVDHTGDGPLLAAGILDGQLRQVMVDFALLRQAQLELQHPEQAAQRSFVSTNLTWDQLTVTEQTRVGTLWLIGDAGLLAGRALSQLQRLLALKLPLKILVLADLDLGIATPPNLELTTVAVPDADIELSLVNLAHRNVYVAQSAVSFPQHLLTTLQQMLSYTGTSILHLHTPSPRRHGFPSGRSLARTHDAVVSRVFPLFRYDPRSTGVFGSRFSLDGNPQHSGKRTPAHYALGEERFAALFNPLAANANNPLAIEDYLALDPSQRTAYTPFVERMSHNEAPQRLALAPSLVQVCVARHEVWQMLQELAGVITPFTARVRQEIETQLTAAHQAALAAQKADYELQLANLESRLREETRQSLRIRLLELGGYVAR